jgi:hypothetical protein
MVYGIVAWRPELDRCLKALRADDTPVGWRLDRLGRNRIFYNMQASLGALKAKHTTIRQAVVALLATTLARVFAREPISAIRYQRP